MKKNVVKKILLSCLILTCILSSVAVGTTITNHLNTKTIDQLEQVKPDNNYPVKIYNENKELVLETTMQNYLDNRAQIEKEYSLGKYKK